MAAKDTKTTVTELDDTTTTELTNPAAAGEILDAVPKGFVRVVIQKPEGERDSYRFVGFNAFEARVEYGKPTVLPIEVVNDLRTAQRIVTEPDDKLGMRASAAPMFHITEV